MSFPLIQEDMNFEYSDNLEDGNISDINYVNTHNEIKTNNPTNEKSSDAPTSEEEFTYPGLHFLETMVNIEHGKLELQKTENELQESIIETVEEKQDELTNKIDSWKNENPRPKRKLNESSSEEELAPNKMKKKRYSKTKNKCNITKNASGMVKEKKSVQETDTQSKFQKCSLKTNESMNTLKNEKSSEDTKDDVIPEWIKEQFKLHNIKPIYIVIDPMMRYY